MLGENLYHERRSLIGIGQADRLGHMWVLGKTGAGKSTLLTNLIYEDMQAGRGLMVIDPHGDLVESLLDLVPLHRVPDTIYFNPADTAYPLAFNPLDCTTGLSASFVTNGMLAVLKKTWPEFWGPRMEYVLRSSLLTLLRTPHATLLDLHRLLVDLPFRQQIISRLNAVQAGPLPAARPDVPGKPLGRVPRLPATALRQRLAAKARAAPCRCSGRLQRLGPSKRGARSNGLCTEAGENRSHLLVN